MGCAYCKDGSCGHCRLSRNYGFDGDSRRLDRMNTASLSKSLLLAAVDLISDDPKDNPEYDRALVELVTNTLGIQPEHHDAVLTILRTLHA